MRQRGAVLGPMGKIQGTGAESEKKKRKKGLTKKGRTVSELMGRPFSTREKKKKKRAGGHPP